MPPRPTEVAEAVEKAKADAATSQESAIAAAVDEAVQKTVASERARADKPVAEAEDEAAALVDTSASGGDEADAGGADPRFRTCGDANDAGYGPYRSGEPEYDWYQDRDGDGVVCES